MTVFVAGPHPTEGAFQHPSQLQSRIPEAQRSVRYNPPPHHTFDFADPTEEHHFCDGYSTPIDVNNQQIHKCMGLTIVDYII